GDCAGVNVPDGQFLSTIGVGEPATIRAEGGLTNVEPGARLAERAEQAPRPFGSVGIPRVERVVPAGDQQPPALIDELQGQRKAFHRVGRHVLARGREDVDGALIIAAREAVTGWVKGRTDSESCRLPER